jgi:SAM-dependent methyltransferase
MKTFEFEHIYSSNGLYRLFYGGLPMDKHLEAWTAVRTVEEFVHHGNYPVPKEGFQFLEIMSGAGSQHEGYFRQHATFPIKSYYKNELRKYGGMVFPDVMIGDAESLKTDITFDMIFAFFYPLPQIMDNNWNHSRPKMQRVFSNMARLLKTGGGFYFDIAPDGYRIGFEDLIDYHESECMQELVIPYQHPLRDELGLKSHSYVYVNVDREFTYDRIGCCAVTKFDEMQFYEDGKLAVTVDVERPWTQRFWSETEIIDIAKEAGFIDFMFFRSEDQADEADLDLLPNKQATAKKAKHLMPTHIIARV